MNIKKLIGLSLSRCIRDIIENKIPEEKVSKIISRTFATNVSEWNELILSYQSKHWTKNPEQAKKICLRLLKAGKIEQPRVKNETLHSVSEGHWLLQV